MKASRLFRAKAPLRISFAGGGTDTSPFAEEHGGAVVSATINQFAYASLRPRGDSLYSLHNLDDGLRVSGRLARDIEHEGGLTLASAVVRSLGIEQGFDLTLYSEAPWGSGLGGSSTHVVALVGVFARWLSLELDPHAVAELSYQIERVDLKLAGGKQDQYSATFGGFNLMEFTSDGVHLEPLLLDPSTLEELQYRSVLCSLGRTRESAAILRDQLARYVSGDPGTVESMLATRSLAYEMRSALESGRLDSVAELLNEGWLVKRRFSPLVTNPQIDDLYESALRHGAAGGRLLGAGGGGYMLFLCGVEGRPRLTGFLEQQGLRIVPFSFEDKGMTAWVAGVDG